MGGHSEGTEVGKFCAIRAESCKLHSNKYQSNCTNSPGTWAIANFIQGRKVMVEKQFEAHHVLCVACVTEFIAKAGPSQVVRETDWCVNAKKNMLGLPLWGHTIKWYCGLFADVDEDNVEEKLADGTLFKTRKAPPFKNHPQHDYDHNSTDGYKGEVDGRLQLIAQQVKKTAAKNHEAAVKELKTELDNLSDHFKDELNRRGERQEGTHKAWKKGMREPDSDWYEPFSMADDGMAEARSFPSPGAASKLMDKIRSLLEALGRWGAT
jgi:hypothetical protein